MAIRFGLDLAKLIPWLGAWILATLAYYLVYPLVKALDIGIGGIHPFRSIGAALEAGIVEPLNDLRKKSDAEIAHGLSSLVDNLAVFLGLVLVLGLLVKFALSYMWNHALRPLIHSITDTIRATALEALAKVEALDGRVARNLARAEAYAEAQAASALRDARTFAVTEALRAEHAATSYADDAVSKLRLAEDAAFAEAVRLATEAKAAGVAAAHAAEGEAEKVAAQALAQSEAAGHAALAAVRSIAITAEHDLGDLAGKLEGYGLPALIAAVPALALLVNTVVTEAGFGDASCRAKNKQICGVDPTQWENLLLGLAAVGFGFNLGEIVKEAAGLVGETHDLIADVSDLSQDTILDVGHAIGGVVAAIAA